MAGTRPVRETGRLTDRSRRILRALVRMDEQARERAAWLAHRDAHLKGAPGAGHEGVAMPEGDEPHAHVAEDGWHLAYDVAQEAEVDNRAAGPILRALQQRGLARTAERGRPYDVQAADGTVERSEVRTERVWRVTEAGRWAQDRRNLVDEQAKS